MKALSWWFPFGHRKILRDDMPREVITRQHETAKETIAKMRQAIRYLEECHAACPYKTADGTTPCDRKKE